MEPMKTSMGLIAQTRRSGASMMGIKSLNVHLDICALYGTMPTAKMTVGTCNSTSSLI